MDILEQIRAQYDSLNKTRQRISDCILSEPEQCCFCSLKAFARQAGTTEATVLSFCRALGLGSYLELKKALQDYLIQKVNPNTRLRMAVSASSSAQELCARVEREERENLQATFDRNPPEALLAFVRLLEGAERICIAAHDFSRIPAAYLHHRLSTLGLDSTMLDLQDRSGVFTRLSRAPEKDLLIAIAIPPYGDDTVAVTRYCADTGMKVAVITDRPDAPLCRDADAVLQCHVNLLGMTNSYASMVSLMDALSLLYSYTRRDGADDQEREAAARRSRFQSFFLHGNAST